MTQSRYVLIELRQLWDRGTSIPVPRPPPLGPPPSRSQPEALS